MVPPTSNSTGMPVLAVKASRSTFSTVSFQLPPHTLTTRAFCAQAVGTGRDDGEQARDDRGDGTSAHSESPHAGFGACGPGRAHGAAASMASTMWW